MNDEHVYVLTPKGILLSAMIEVGIIEGITFEMFEHCWRLFEERMTEYGYIVEGESE